MLHGSAKVKAMLKPWAVLPFLALVLSGCAQGSPRQTPSPQSTVAPEPTAAITSAAADSPSEAVAPAIAPEEYAVYQTLIKSLYLLEGVEQIVISDHTAIGPSQDASLQEQAEYIRTSMGHSLEPATLEDYIAANGRDYKLENSFLLDAPVVLLTQSEFAEIFADENGWERFYESYPESQGIMTLSRAGFNADRDQALVYAGNQRDYLAGRGNIILLAKRGGEWEIDQVILAWIS